MSHFAVLVIGDDPEGQLRMYDEKLEVERYKRYLDRSETSWPLSNAVEAGIDAADYPAVAGFLSAQWSGEETYEADDLGVYEWTTYNPESKWDWYSLGGRWTGFFLLRDERSGDVGSPGLMTRPAPKGRADAARKGDIDFDGMSLAHAAEAADEYDAWWRVAGDNLPPRWKDVLDRHGTENIQAAREEYGSHPTIAALRRARLYPWNEDALDYYGSDRDAFITRLARSRCTTYAMVAEGVWKAKGEMGWFGMSADEGDPEDWRDFWWRMVNGMPDDMLLSVFDCHI